MALIDMESNLAKGAGKPSGNASGNIPNDSKVTPEIKSKTGKLRNRLINQSTPEIKKYVELTANGKKV